MRTDSVASRSARALVLLTLSGIRRMLREGLVVRSLLWPGLVTSLTLAATLVVTAAFRPGRTVVVGPDVDSALVQSLREADFLVSEVPDAQAVIEACDATIGVVPNPASAGGYDLWVCGTAPSALEVEGMLRTRSGSNWIPVPPRPPDPKTRNLHGDLVCRILGMLFVLYGLVFGLGGVARDRDDGSLEAELALPIPRWVGGLARWVASSLVLCVFYGASILAFSAMLVVRDFDDVLRHGMAAASVGVALGLSVVGTAGLKNGFSGPLAVGMTGATGLATLGAAMTLTWVPIASLFTDGDGWSSLGTALVLGLGAAWLYGRRAGAS